MNRKILLTPQTLVDPLGETARAPVTLAQRTAALDGKRLLFMDNGQLATGWPRYGALFDLLQAELEARHAGLQFARRKAALVQSTEADLQALVAAILADGIDTVVIALAHAGVTLPSVLFAAELERNGIPTVLLCTPLGGPLAEIMAQGYVPGLPILVLQPDASHDEARVRSVASELVEPLCASLNRGKTGSSRKTRSSKKKQAPGTAPMLMRSAGKLQLKARASLSVPARGAAAWQSEVDPSLFAEGLYAALCEAGMCDGFPVIAPTPARVRAMLRFTDRAADTVLVPEVPPSGAAITVGKIAVSAVMAGCRPEYFPIVLTAFEAMAEPRYRLFQGVITTHPAGNAVIVSGPLARELGIHSGAGCMGPGFRANATIGRTLTLAMMNIARAIPGRSDLSSFGSPAEYSYCFAETDENHPWQPFHVEFRDAATTTVTVHKVEGPHNVIAHLGPRPEDILQAVAAQAATIAGNNYSWPCELIVVFNPAHARSMAAAGWSKADVQQYLFEHARNPVEPMRRAHGIPAEWPAWFANEERVPVVTEPGEIHVFVAGAAGPHDMVCPPWGLSRLVTRAVTLKDGRPVRSLADFSRGRARNTGKAQRSAKR